MSDASFQTLQNLQSPQLNERAQGLLKALVERYIADGQPVGSRALSKLFDLSPASIRNVMADLEDCGFIASPHTSAGRIPTSRGYRVFVDTLLTIRPLEQVEIEHLEGQLQTDNRQRLIASASQMLADLTRFAGIVTTPRRGTSFRHIEFLNLGEKRILLILVTPDGDVQNRILHAQRAFTPGELNEASNFLNQNYAGVELEDVRRRLRDELQQLHADMTRLMSAALEPGSDSQGPEDVVIAGGGQLLEVHDLSSNMASLRQLFGLFERKTALMQLLEIGSRAQGVQLYIGGEAGLAPLDECSLITAPYEVDGKVVGTLGVIGPTRMAYERVIPIVEITAKLLSSALSQH